MSVNASSSILSQNHQSVEPSSPEPIYQQINIKEVRLQSKELPKQPENAPELKNRMYFRANYRVNREAMEGSPLYAMLNEYSADNVPIVPGFPRKDVLASALFSSASLNTDEYRALPLLHAAKEALLRANPNLPNEVCKLSHVFDSSRNLKVQDLAYLCNATVLSKLNAKELKVIINKCKAKSKSRQKTEKQVARLILQYLNKTRTQEVAKALGDIIKKTGAEPTQAQRAEFGLDFLTTDEISKLSLQDLFNEITQDPVGVLSLNTEKLIAFIKNVAHWYQTYPMPHSNELLRLINFIAGQIGDNLHRSIRDTFIYYCTFEDGINLGPKALIEIWLADLKSVMREVRKIIPGPSSIEIVEYLPEKILFFDKADFGKIKPEQISLLDHQQLVALAIVCDLLARELALKPGKHPNVEHHLKQILDPLRERILGLLRFANTPELTGYARRAEYEVQNADHNVYGCDHQKNQALPLSREAYTGNAVEPIIFIKDADFAALTTKDIQALDVDKILSMPLDNQLKWFVSNLQTQILKTEDPYKMLSWIKVLRYLHHKSLSPKLHLAIEAQATLLGVSWLRKMEARHPKLNLSEYQALIESILKLRQFRQQSGTRGYTSLVENNISPAQISAMSAKALLNIKLDDYANLSTAHSIALSDALFNQISCRFHWLSNIRSDEFALLQRLYFLYQESLLNAYSTNHSPSEQELAALKILKNRINECRSHMLEYRPFTQLELKQEVISKAGNKAADFSKRKIDPEGIKKPHHIVPFGLDETGKWDGPALYGYINQASVAGLAIHEPLAIICAKKFIDLSKATELELNALPFLFAARQKLKDVAPNINPLKQRLSHGEKFSKVLSLKELKLCTNANMLGILSAERLFELIQSLSNTVKLAQKKHNLLQLEAAKLIAKYLFITRLNRPNSALAPVSRKAKKRLEEIIKDETLTANKAQILPFGIAYIQAREIKNLSINQLYKFYFTDKAGFLHLSFEQMLAFIKAVRSAKESGKNVETNKLNLLVNFIESEIGKHLPLSVENPLEGYSQGRDKALNLKIIRAFRRQMRAIRWFKTQPNMINIRQFTPSHIALMGSSELVAIDPRDIARINPDQAMALCLTISEMAGDFAKLKGKAPNLTNKFEAVLSALRERVEAVLPYVDAKGIKHYVDCATELLLKADTQYYARAQDVLFPLIQPAQSKKIPPNKFVQVANFTRISKGDIERLDLVAVLHKPKLEQLEWFLQNDLAEILNCKDPNKIFSWVQAIKYLHHKTDSAELRIAIEYQATLLRYIWLSQFADAANLVTEKTKQVAALLDSIFELGISRFTVNNQFISFNKLSSLQLAQMSATELNQCDWQEFATLSCEKVIEYSRAIWMVIRKNIRALKEATSIEFSLYQRLCLLHQLWVYSHFSSPTQLDPKLMDATSRLDGIIKACHEHRYKDQPIVKQGFAQFLFSSDLNLSHFERQRQQAIWVSQHRVATPVFAQASNHNASAQGLAKVRYR